ncbi:MAG: hypothetical protein HYS38_05725 [Acidobacteria bacterium]|nr:hypothetical protein [Acidobacteriota bacterium]
MRKQKAVITMLNGLVKLLKEEIDRNPDFADRLEALLSPVPRSKIVRRQLTKAGPKDVPDAYAEFASRGESEFRLWLRDQSNDVLHSLIWHHDLDATRRSAKWKDPEKLSAFITDKIRSRLARGSGFLTSGDQSQGDSTT